MNESLDALLAFARNLPEISAGFFTIIAVIGFFMVGIGLINHAKHARMNSPMGKSQGSPFSETMVWVITGSMMIAIKPIVFAVNRTLFSVDARTPRTGLDYVETGGDDITVALNVIIHLVAVFGWFGVYKGIQSWRVGKLNGENSWFGKGMTFVVAGSVLTNLDVALLYLGNTFGQGQYVSFLNNF